METQAHYQPPVRESAGLTLFEAYMQWARAHEAREAAGPREAKHGAVPSWGVRIEESAEQAQRASLRVAR
jgi:hypothetical protein